MQKKDNIERYSAEELAAKCAQGESQTDWSRIDSMSEEASKEAVVSISNSATPSEDWTEIIRDVPEIVEPKKHMNIRLDADVWRWFRAQGKGYQSKMNAVLRTYMQVQQRKDQLPSHHH